MWSLSSLRRLSSSPSIGINGSLKSASHLPSRSAAASPDCLDSSHFALYALNFKSFIHSAGRKDEMWRNSEPLDPMGVRGQGNSDTGRITNRNSEPLDPMGVRGQGNSETGRITNRNSEPLDPMGVRGQGNSETGRITNRNSEPLDPMGVRGQGNSETGRITNTMDFIKNTIMEADSQRYSRNGARGQFNSEIGRNFRPIPVWRAVEQDGFRQAQYKVEQNPHCVLIQLKRNSTHINVTDSKGDTKFWTSSGNKAVGGGGKVSRYAAEATAEYVGRRVREMGLKSVVMRVKGFTHFKKKRQAIMSFKEGFSGSRSNDNPVVYIEDVTRKPHNGCRLPKKRRI